MRRHSDRAARSHGNDTGSYTCAFRCSSGPRRLFLRTLVVSASHNHAQQHEDHRGKLRAMVVAGETRATCAEQNADQYGSIIDDAANQFDSTGDEAAIVGDAACSCTLHHCALTIENEALQRKLSSIDRGTIKNRREDTRRELRPCH